MSRRPGMSVDLAIVYWNQARTALSQAVKADGERDYEQAIKFYHTACENFIRVKVQPTAKPEYVQQATIKAQECADRAKTLKDFLASPPSPAKPSEQPQTVTVAQQPPSPAPRASPHTRLSKKASTSISIKKPLIEDPEMEQVAVARECLRKAIAMERAGSFAEATKCYEEALAKFEPIAAAASDTPGTQANAEYSVQLCKLRIQCLEFYPKKCSPTLAQSYFFEAITMIKCITEDDDKTTISSLCIEARKKLRLAELYTGEDTPISQEIHKQIEFCNERIIGEEPSAMQIEEPCLHLDDVPGEDEVKTVIRDLVTSSNESKTVLIFGPAGVHKAQFVEAAATEMKYKIISADGYDFIGPKEQPLSQLSQFFDQVRASAPVLMFLKNIDVLVPKVEGQHGRVEHVVGIIRKNLATLNGVVCFASANLPWTIDERLLGLFGTKLYIKMPLLETRIKFLTDELSVTSHSLSDEQIARVAQQIDQFTLCDIKRLVRTAEVAAVTRGQEDKDAALLKCARDESVSFAEVRFEDFEHVLKEQLVTPTLEGSDLRMFWQFAHR